MNIRYNILTMSITVFGDVLEMQFVKIYFWKFVSMFFLSTSSVRYAVLKINLKLHYNTIKHNIKSFSTVVRH